MNRNKRQKKPNSSPGKGTVIRGKWHHQAYRVKRKLGSGAIGSVYLCEHNGRNKALKISGNSASMTVEVNVLKSLEKVQGNQLGPSLFDVDDWVGPDGANYTFYVMEYLQGESLGDFIKQNGEEWIGVLMLQLLDDLERLHQAGWVFGDLKTDNLLVVSSPAKIRWVDVGGTTRSGRAIKEYTEFYDRGYWGLGSRRAEPSYDLFAFVMIFLEIFFPNRFERNANPEKLLLAKINQIPSLRAYRPCLRKAIQGNYQTSSQMKREMAALLYQIQRSSGKYRNRRRSTTRGAPLGMELAGISLLSIIYYVSSLLLP